MAKRSPFRYFKTSPEIIRLVLMLYARFPLSLWSVEDLLHERGTAALAEWHELGVAQRETLLTIQRLVRIGLTALC